MPASVLVSVDGSEDSDKAFQFAVKILKGRHLYILHVCEVTGTSFLDPFHDKLDHFNNLKAKELAQKIEEKYRTWASSIGGLDFTFICIEKSSPKEAICEKVAELGNVELVVTGSRGLGQIKRMIVGSVSSYLTHYCSSPVLVDGGSRGDERGQGAEEGVSQQRDAGRHVEQPRQRRDPREHRAEREQRGHDGDAVEDDVDKQRAEALGAAAARAEQLAPGPQVVREGREHVALRVAAVVAVLVVRHGVEGAPHEQGRRHLQHHVEVRLQREVQVHVGAERVGEEEERSRRRAVVHEAGEEDDAADHGEAEPRRQRAQYQVGAQRDAHAAGLLVGVPEAQLEDVKVGVARQLDRAGERDRPERIKGAREGQHVPAEGKAHQREEVEYHGPEEKHDEVVLCADQEDECGQRRTESK